MNNRFLFLFIASFVFISSFLLLTSDAYAETAILYPMKDNTIYAGAQFENNSCGAGSGVISGNTNNNLARRALIMFDVASVIPTGALITNVELTMTVNRSRAEAFNFSLHQLTADWGEGASDCDASAGQGVPAVAPDATWLTAMFPNTPPPWTTSGGDYVATPSATTLVGTGNGPYTWASTAALVSDTQNWVDNVTPNFGWIVIGNETVTQSAYSFDSKEGTNPPTLTVTFTCPPGGCVACCDTLSCEFVAPDNCADPRGTTCAPDTCVDEPGACCIPDEDMNFTCQDLFPADCAAQGGIFKGAGTSQCRDTNICGLEPWRDELPLPGAASPVGTRADGVPQYEITMSQFEQNLHRDQPDTTVWGYNGSFPGPTIEATVGQAIEVKYINDLRDFADNPLTTHFLAVDKCPHGPNYWRNAARTTVHLHGGHVPARFDGLPEYDFFPGEFDIFEYPNNQIATTMWYHDHALGITRLNVIMGLAGFYILRDDLENNLGLPSGPYEVPLVLQDRDFDANGEFVYPDQLQQTYHGQSIVVNGKVWPYLDVDQGKYRFRVLNGSTTRTYTVRFENTTDRTLLPITVIGTEGGLYQNARPAPNNEVTLAPAERFELIVDFAGLARRTEVIMKNSAVTDFPTGSSPMGGTQNLVKFIVGRRTGFTGPVPDPLRPFSAIDPATISVPPRPFNLVRVPEACAGGEWLVQSLDAPPPGGAVIGEHWDDITEYPILGNTEIWEFYNMSSLMHPMHIHLVLFQVINRQAVDTQGNLVGPIIPPDPLEVNSWKETVQAKPGMVTRVIMTFEDYTGKFPYHCHIIEHEDHEMMRQFQTTYDPDLAVIDGVCSPMEDCISNPTDCPTASGALCGNKLCEIEDGEDCLNCPEDCAGQQIGAPDDFCCGSGAGTNPVTNCGFDADGFTVLDNRCLSNEFYCRVKARVPACCGDSLCEGQETSVSCPTDCAPTGACTYVDPTVVITPPAQDVNAGNSVTYTVSVTNNDTGACPMTTFNLTVDDSDNGADFVTPSTVNPTSVMLMPGASQDVILTVTAQPDGTGSNDTAVTATDTALPPNHADVTSNMVTTTIVAVQPAVGVRNGELVSGRYEGPKKNQVFVPAATFTVGEDVFIHAIVRDQTENPVENADVELTITGPAGYANVLVASQSDPNGLVETKWRTRRLDPGAYTITVTNVTNGVMWDGVMTNINVTLQ